jgi:hypothetical protein
MCSLSWSRSRGRLVVVMNRDERRDRAAARPPRRWPGGFTAPIDPDGGGTWIAARDSGVVVALLNHQPGRGVRLPPPETRVSRGRLVADLAAERTLPTAARLRTAGLAAFAPFRLFVAGPSVPPRVFTWNGRALTARRLAPRLGFLTSSSWQPRQVIPARHARFRAFARAQPQPTPTSDALVAFHEQTADPRGPAWAIRMEREDARTVSTTIVDAGPSRVAIDYRAR